MNKQDFIEWVGDNKGKVFAITISCIYLLLSFLFGHSYDWIKVLMFLILSLACIFFGEAMGGYTGITGLAEPWIAKTSPGCFVTFLGWVLLLLPLIMVVLAVIFHWK